MKKIFLLFAILTLTLSAGVFLSGCGPSEEEQAAIDAFNAEVTRIQDQIDQRDKAVEEAQTLLKDERPPLYEDDQIPLEDAVKEAKAISFEAPDVPKELEEINSATEELKGIDYEEPIKKVEDATVALDISKRKCELVTAPDEKYVIKCLEKVKDIKKVAAVTEDNDPNGMLGKQGGYTAQIYFSSPMVKDPYDLYTGKPIKDGTDGGGSIEVYSTNDEAKTREEYLAGFDSTGGLSSGSHIVVGTCLVRTSSELKASQQKKLQNEIIDALTELEG
ncbi:hypothetical protein [Eubacterium sp. AB3007]|uniref:hypothetical protein n=1 Tax=Eubacterium sp. AB3007 TaxID=1392487 RepID=UPI000486B24F|nr:hypothetical protein [Eubacterium sp. AB3007]